MAGYFSLGENKIRSGACQTQQIWQRCDAL